MNDRIFGMIKYCTKPNKIQSLSWKNNFGIRTKLDNNKISANYEGFIQP